MPKAARLRKTTEGRGLISVYVLPEEGKAIREVAAKESLSASAWAARVLIKAADKASKS